MNDDNPTGEVRPMINREPPNANKNAGRSVGKTVLRDLGGWFDHARGGRGWRAGDWHALNRAFGVRPWQVSPFDATGTAPNPGSPWSELRQALIAAAGPPGRVGRHGEPLARISHRE
jgi:hypothetical protein